MKALRHIVWILLVMVAWEASAQPGPDPELRERVEALKVSFITKKLQLTTEEAQKFWPVYNEYEADREEIRMEMNELRRKMSGLEYMTDKEVEDALSRMTDLRIEEAQLSKQYIPKFRQVVSIQKVANLFKAEEDFMRTIMNRMNKDELPGGKPGPPR